MVKSNYKKDNGELWVSIVVYAVIIFATIVCLAPFLRVFSQALSADKYVMSGSITLFPKGFTLKHMKFVMDSFQFRRSLLVSVTSTLVYTFISMIFTIMTAYPLSRKIRGRKWMMFFIVFTMMFNGGIIPTYLVVSKVGLLNNFWSLIIPRLLSAYNIIILITSFRALPVEFEEAARIDGAGHFRTLWQIMVPLVKPTLAVLLLYYAIFRWNSWFDALLYVDDVNLLVLPLFVRNVIQSGNSAISNIIRTEPSPTVSVQAAAVIFSMLPILVLYPFLQKYFVKGVMIGGIKG